MSYDPDFVITVDGTDYTKYCMSWKLVEVEKGTSTLTVKLGCEGQELLGKIKKGMTAKIIFGYVNDMRESVEMKIKQRKEKGSVDKDNNYVLFIAMDCTAELAGGNTNVGGGGLPGQIPEKPKG